MGKCRTQTLINTQGNHKEQPQEGNVPQEEALTGNSPLLSTLACRVRLSSKVTHPEREEARSKQEQSPPLCSPDSSHQCPQPSSTFPAHRLETARRRKRLFAVETHNRDNYQLLLLASSCSFLGRVVLAWEGATVGSPCCPSHPVPDISGCLEIVFFLWF